MDTFLGLLAGNTLTRLVFFPAVACLPLLFFPRSAARATKIYALAALSTFFWKIVDVLLIDGSVNTAAATARVAGEVGRFTTTGNVRNYARYFFVGVILLFLWLIL